MNCKSILSVFLIFILTFVMCSTAFAADDIPDGYTPIYTAEELNNIRNNLSGKYILMNDIDLSAYENWNPIGTNSAPFIGAFDGNDFSIKNLSLKYDINSDETNNLGFFGFVKTATILKLKINNLTVNINYPYNSTFFVGGAVAYCFDSEISSCEVTGNISILSGGNIYAGGIAGYIGDENKSTVIKNCVSQVDMQIIGENNSIWEPEVSQYTYVGGIVGSASQAEKIYKCSNNGNISVNSINIGIVGSIVGNAEDVEISKCKNTGNITALGTCVTNETPINISLWNRILLLFSSIWNYFAELFK